MKLFARTLSFPLLASAALLASCSGGGGGESSSTGGGSAMAIVSCSLGCSGGAGGAIVTCGITQMYVNQEVSVLFTQPVNLATVSKNTFQVVDLSTGKAPNGTFTLDTSDPHRVIFRPQLTFDSSGNPVFGLTQGATYKIKVPGSNQDTSGPWIASTSGNSNVSRLECTVIASGVNDVKPGAPTVAATVDVVDSYLPSGEPDVILEDVPASGAENVYRFSDVTLLFDDLMNPATLVNPVTGASGTIAVSVDLDGDLTDASDQTPVFGTFQIALDQVALTTTVVFTPSGGFPSAGTGVDKRRIVVDLPPQILDLGGNPLANAGPVAFTPEVIPFAEMLLPDGTGELFQTATNLDAKRTGVAWGSGALFWALLEPTSQDLFTGGGSGRHGDLVIDTGEVVTLSTDDQDFSDLAQLIPSGSTDPDPAVGLTETVTDGIIEFSSLIIRPGGVLRINGANPARVFVRGEALVQGLIDVSGRAPVGDDLNGNKLGWVTTTSGTEFDKSIDGGLGGTGGPAAGIGGRGADRPDNDATLQALGTPTKGISNPGAVIDGAEGEGVGGADPAASATGGAGGVHWPDTLPPTSAAPPNPIGFSPQYSGQMALGVFTCESDMIGGAGAGGAFATNGKKGLPLTSTTVLLLNPAEQVPFLTPDAPPPFGKPALGGDSTTIDLLNFKTLSPDGGYLQGGAGGGGGGTHINRTKTGASSGSCYTTAIQVYVSHSAAGGGGGGGAVQLQAGRRLAIDGVVDASGGAGGSGVGAGGANKTDLAMPGGGGSGGGILLQSVELQIADVPARLDVSGGLGGVGAFGSQGGIGGAGFVRLESALPGDPLDQAPKLLPFDAAGTDFGGADSDKILSLTQWAFDFNGGPDSRAGAQSCWIRPDGNFFLLDFTEDDIPGGVYGWDMDVLLAVPGTQPISYRDGTDPDNPFGTSIEVLLGNDLGGVTPAPIAVRFQGARAVKAIDNLCDIDTSDALGPILPGSVTGWVRHPAELDVYFDHLPPDQAAKLRPNLVRFVVIYDRSTGLVPAPIQAITNFVIRATPD